MKTNNFLFPACFRKIGWIISLPFAAILVYYLAVGFPTHGGEAYNFFKEMFDTPDWRIFGIIAGERRFLSVCMVLLVAGLLFIAFSREKMEDEYIAKMRNDSLIWSVIVNSILLLAVFLLVYGGSFLYVVFCNLYTQLILFIIKYNIALYRFRKSGDYEE
jgi:ABC-type Fe3+-siderophore transport system permease subunit